MPRFLVLLTVASTLTLAPSTNARAQPRVSFEATVGKGLGVTRGEYKDNRSGLVADALLAARLRPVAGGALVAGLSTSAQGAGSTTSECRPASDGGCVPIFPSFLVVSPLVGWENSRATLRAMIGPALVQGHEEPWTWTMGVQGRLDAVVVTFRRLAVVASLRPTLIPNYRGDAVGLVAFGLGLRLR